MFGEPLSGWGAITLPWLITHRIAKPALSLIGFFFLAAYFSFFLLLCQSVVILINANKFEKCEIILTPVTLKVAYLFLL